jgi:RHS repeat-associated protein
MDASPWFDSPDLFDPARIRLADVDGAGCTDLVYLHTDGARIYINESGNGWSPDLGRELPSFPRSDHLSSVQLIDLLGNGTACLVWSTSLPGAERTSMKYVDLMSGQKPYLLRTVRNNRGATTEIEYTPSTKFYLEDERAGVPWATRLPFPVYCVSKVTISDKWRNTRFATTYSYHHGYYDSPEREFRGFGRVDQVDCESYGTFAAGNASSPYITADRSLYQPPVKTVTWFHTGAFLGASRSLGQFADEYFPASAVGRNPALVAALGGFAEPPLPEPDLLQLDLSTDELREALRACKGTTLRQEIYELDVDDLTAGKETPVRLFSTAYHNARIDRVQPRSGQRHTVFLVTESESMSFQYELDLRTPVAVDPRISHTLTLEQNAIGQPLQSIAIGYPRRGAFFDSRNFLAPETVQTIRDVQAELHFAYTEYRLTDADIDGVEHYRLRMPCETATFDVTGIRPRNGPYFSIGELRAYRLSERYQQAGAPVPPIAFHVRPDGTPQKRLVSLSRTLYFDDPSATVAPAGPLPFARHGPRGLKFEDYNLALTDELLAAVLGDRLDETIVGMQTIRSILDDADLSGYANGALLVGRFAPEVPVASLAGQYWVRSGVAGFDGDAHLHFFLPGRYTDPFGSPTRLAYDPYDLMPRSSEDARGNEMQALAFDYRVLAPRALQDANATVTRIAFDGFGSPSAVALEAGGDSIAGITFASLNATVAERAAFFSLDPYRDNQPRAWLAQATTRFVYYLGEQVAANGTIQGWEAHPAAACTIQRETHVAQLAAAPTRIQVSVEYSDGTGNLLLKAAQAEPDPESAVLPRPLRWIVSGKTVFNNKGKAVKQYEPYFSDSEHRFSPADAVREVGVTPILYYDAPGRLIRTEHPDDTIVQVEFSPWLTRAFDANDTVLASGWYASRGAPDPRLAMPLGAEARAAWLAARHANTPAEVHLDSVAREVVAVAHNRDVDANGALRDVLNVTYTKLDAEGKALWIRDARGNLVTQYITPGKAARWADEPNEDVPAGAAPGYDLVGQLLYQRSMDSGERWMLMDALGKPMAAWDQNERQSGANVAIETRLYYTEYDVLHRPTALWLRVGAAPRVMAERFEYRDVRDPDGSPNPNLAADRAANLIGQARRHYDPSGRSELVRRDFKGNPLESAKRLNNRPTASVVDWQANPETLLEAEEFSQLNEFDALNRLTRFYNWHRGNGSRVAVYRPLYNERGLLVSESVTVGARKTAAGIAPGVGTTVNAIEEVRYNAKGQQTYLARGGAAGGAAAAGTLTEYDYDPKTFRLRQIFTTRPAQGRPRANRRAGLADPRVVQDVTYTFDPVGNIVECEDQAYEPVFFQNQIVEPRSQYEYDALYRLIRATGRESGAFTGPPERVEGAWTDVTFPIGAGDPNALRTYTQSFRYDAAGNLERIRHQAGIGTWTRRFRYADDSNALRASWDTNDDWAQVNPTLVTSYQFESHGNMRNLTASAPRYDPRWDHRDMIERIDLGGGGTAYYQYDSTRQRTRKRIVDRNGPGYWERIYLAGYELYRRFGAAGAAAPVEEIDSLHLMHNDQRVLLVDDVIVTDRTHADGRAYSTGPLFRFQFSNHLGSCMLELDEENEVIGYEEFHPYGTSAYRLVRRDTEAAARRYRYTGMERDEESGLSYHTARYYAPWLARWVSADPAGSRAGPNLYAYSSGNPLTARDTGGQQDDKPVEDAAYLGRMAAWFADQGWMDEAREYQARARQKTLEEALERSHAVQREGEIFAGAVWLTMGAAIVTGVAIGAAGGFTVLAETLSVVARALRPALAAAEEGLSLAGAALRPRVAALALRAASLEILPAAGGSTSAAITVTTTGAAGSTLVPTGTAVALTTGAGTTVTATTVTATVGAATTVTAVVVMVATALNPDPLGLNHQPPAFNAPPRVSYADWQGAFQPSLDRGTYREQVRQHILNTPNHELRFLLDADGNWNRPPTRAHSNLINALDVVEMAHVISDKSGIPGPMMVMDAWTNQRFSLLIEGRRAGGENLGMYVRLPEALDIGGFLVYPEYARTLATTINPATGKPFVDPAVVRNATRVTLP